MADPSFLGRYRIVSRLGAGAMGDVFLAEDPQIDRQLAIKTVKLHGSAEEVEVRKQRMLVEARAAGRVVHPHVVTLFDAGEDGETVYLVFEYVEGQDLGIKLKSGSGVSLREALRIVGQTASALHYAHRMGIVHRDIKPSNIMLTADGQAKVGDFGIAKLHNQETDLTTTGMLIGTPHYMSPEQVRGETLDGRSDVFSLGSVLFELLHRRRPFPSETLTTLVYQILHEDPTEGLRDNLPADLAALLRKMLAKSFDDRSDAGAVAEEIERLLRDMPLDQLEHEAWTVEGLAAPELPSGPAAVPPPLESPPIEEHRPVPPTPSLPTLESPPPQSSPPQSAAVPVATTSPPPPESTAVSTSANPVSSSRRFLPLVAALGCLGVVALGGLAAVGFWWSSRSAEQPPVVGTVEEDSPLGDVARLPPGDDSDSDSSVAELPVDDAEALESASDPDSSDSTADDVEVRVLNPADSEASPAVAETTPEREPATRPVRQPVPRPAVVRPVRDDPPLAVATTPESEGAEEPDAVPSPVPAEDFSGIAVDLARDVSMAVGFRIKPDDVFVLFRRPGENRFTNIGRSRDYDMKRKRRAAYQLPGPGPYLVVLRRDGLADYRMRLNATGRGEPTLIEVTLEN